LLIAGSCGLLLGPGGWAGPQQDARQRAGFVPVQEADSIMNQRSRITNDSTIKDRKISN
jgi:hypothetical protein